MATLFTQRFMKVPKIPFLKSFNEIGRNAFVDWILILILNVSIAIILIIGGLYLYWEISTGKFVGSDVETKADTTVFDQKGLESITKSLDQKKQNIQEIRGGYTETRDPSL